MSKYMHIAREGLFGLRSLCGKRLREGDGAAHNAPLCPTCYRRSGWPHDKRH